jgi:hypothetical protein
MTSGLLIVDIQRDCFPGAAIPGATVHAALAADYASVFGADELLG